MHYPKHWPNYQVPSTKLKKKEFDVTLTVNGVEINFIEFADTFFNQLDRMSREEAESIVEDKLAKIDHLVGDIVERLQDILNNKVEAMLKEE